MYIPIVSDLIYLCSGKHSTKPLPFDPDDEIWDGLYSTRYFKSPITGLLVYHRTWEAEGKCIGVVYLFHGMGEYCGRYEKVAQKFAQAGITVHAIDHQGHGHSEGDRVYFEKLDHMVKDAVYFIDRVKPAPPEIPAFVLGHSMGGLVSLHVSLALQPETIKGMVLSGPALSFDKKLDTAFNRFIVKSISDSFPKLGVAKIRTTTIAAARDTVLQYERDPMIDHGKVKARVAFEMMAGVDRIMQQASKIDIPILILHGENDLLCEISGSKMLISKLTNKDHKLVPIPRMCHEIFFEKDGTVPISMALEWILERCGQSVRID